jgi:hypothetical protein
MGDYFFMDEISGRHVRRDIALVGKLVPLIDKKLEKVDESGDIAVLGRKSRAVYVRPGLAGIRFALFSIFRAGGRL